MIQAVVFDFDGLIVDTETPEYDTWKDIFESYGATLARDVWEWSIGRHSLNFNIYEHLADLSGREIEPEVVRPRMRQQYLERIERNPILPGVEEYLETARVLGLRLAVASSSTPGWAAMHLTSRGLLDYFEFVLSAGDVENPKPDPELYTMAVERLGVEPRNCLAIEDSAVGLTAAKAAGLRCVVVPNPMTSGMNFEKADLLLDSLADVQLEEILQQFEHGLIQEGESLLQEGGPTRKAD